MKKGIRRTAVMCCTILLSAGLSGYGLHEENYNHRHHTLEQPRDYSWQTVQNVRWQPPQTNRTATQQTAAQQTVPPARKADKLFNKPLLSAGGFYRFEGPSAGIFIHFQLSHQLTGKLSLLLGAEAEGAIRTYKTYYWINYNRYSTTWQEPSFSVRIMSGLSLQLTGQIELAAKTSFGVTHDPWLGGITTQLDFSLCGRWWFTEKWGIEMQPGWQLDDFEYSYLTLKIGAAYRL